MTSQEDKLAKLVDLMEEIPPQKTYADNDMRELQSLRQALLRTESAPASKPFNQALHNRIMAEIATEVPQARWKVKFLRPQVFAPVAAAVVAIVTVSLINFQNSRPERPLAGIDSPIVISEETPVNQMILSEAKKDPATAAQALNAADSEQEFLMDALANQLEGLSGEQVDTVFESLMEE